MALSAFDDKTTEPRAAKLKATLGRASVLWEKLRDQLSFEYKPLTEKWNFAGQKWGWSLQLKQQKRTVVYLTPCEGYFVAGFALGEKAVRAAHESGLPDSVMSLIDSAKKYAEGRAVRIEVRTRRDVDSVLRLVAVKMSN